MQWFSNLSGGRKLLMGLLILLLLFLILVTAPYTLMLLLRGTRAAGDAFFASSRQALAAVSAMGSYEVAAGDKNAIREIAMVDSLAAPTPTYTPPPTSTPASAPVATPAVVNVALLSSQSSDTAGVFVPAPAGAEEVGAGAVDAVAAPPTDAPVQAAVALPRAWDGRLDQLGVTVEPANVAPGQPYWRVIEGRWADEAESGGKHHIYVEVLDENGARIVGQPVTVFWGDGNMTANIEDKPAPDFGYNFQMYASGYAYNAKVEGLPSEIVKGAGMGSIEARFKGIHTSYYFVFQRAIK